MGKETEISWARSSHNFWHGCMKVSPGCKHCYAETQSKRFGRKDIWGPDHNIWVPSEKYQRQLYKWDKEAATTGEQWLVFVNSMSDFFEMHPALNELRAAAFKTIDETPHLTYLLLTKRADNIQDMIPAHWLESFPQNVWLGTSVESPDYFWRLDYISLLDAPVHFVSFEPLLAPVADEFQHLAWLRSTGLTPEFLERNWWFIIGGESGPGAREMEADWAEDLLATISHYNTCTVMKITPFVKQLGSVWAKKSNAKHNKGGDITEWPLSLQVREVPNV